MLFFREGILVCVVFSLNRGSGDPGKWANILPTLLDLTAS